MTTESQEPNEYVTALMVFQTLPQEMRALLQRCGDRILKLAEKLQLPPNQVLAGLAVIGAGVVTSNCDPHDEKTINERIHFADAALHALTAAMRIEQGVFDADGNA